jgi:hypothetical protein
MPKLINRMRYIKIISIVLAVSLLLFGILKFINPFKTWYQIQVLNSGLGEISYYVGIAGEIFVGLLLIFALLLRAKLTYRIFSISVVASSLAIVVMMITATYVHLHPDVPASVLPLKIKPPFIPGLFLLLAVLNSYLMIKNTNEAPWPTTKS